MKDAAVWQALPSDEHQSVWHETERNFWDRFKRDTETERSAANARFHEESVGIRVELRNMSDLRMQLSDRRSRMAREMAQVEEDLARAAASCNDKANRLAAMEQEYRESLHARMETREEVCKSMTNFFREKRGEGPLTELGPRLPRIETRDQGDERINDAEANGVPTPARSTSTENVLVNVVDADGRYVGPVERIEPWNQWVEGIQDLPIQRPVIIRRGRRFNKDHLSSIYERTEAKGVKWLSCMIQAIGEVQKRRCQSCEKNQGAFENCVIVGGEMFPKCGNCEWNRQGCHGASAEWIDMQAAQEQARRKKLLEPPTPTEKEPETAKLPEPPMEPAPEKRAMEAREEAQRLAAEEGMRQMRLKERTLHASPYGAPRIEPRRHAGPTPPPQGLEDERIARMAIARMTGIGDQPLPRPINQRSPQLPPLPRREGTGFVDPIRHMNNEDSPMREIPPPNGSIYHQPESHRRPLPKEPRPYMGFTPANLRSTPASHDITPAPRSAEPSPRIPQSPDEPLSEITSKNLVLRHNGTVYTYPECMEGVPVAKIDKDHPYWEAHWKDVRKDITRQWERWKEKHQATIEAEARGEKGGSSKYQIGRQVNRGAKILEFLDSGEISPYQLLTKRFLHTSKGGITSYDTLFRLSESLSELEKFNLDVTPIEWLRHRLHEIYEIEGPNFNMPRTIHDFYHDKKLASLRAKAGFRNIGRPSGKSTGGSTANSTSNTPQGSLGKRKSMHWPSEAPMETTFINQSPGTAMAGRFRNIIMPESHFNKRPKSNHSSETPARSAGTVATDSDSNTGVLLTEDDFRIYQAKTSQYASSPKVSQYVRSTKGPNGVSLDVRVLTGSGASEKWCKPELKDPNVTSVDLSTTKHLRYNRQALKASILVGDEEATSSKGNDLLLEFKRESTLLRFVEMCKRHNPQDHQFSEVSTEEMEREWKEFKFEVQLSGDEKLIPLEG